MFLWRWGLFNECFSALFGFDRSFFDSFFFFAISIESIEEFIVISSFLESIKAWFFISGIGVAWGDFRFFIFDKDIFAYFGRFFIYFVDYDSSVVDFSRMDGRFFIDYLDFFKGYGGFFIFFFEWFFRFLEFALGEFVFVGFRWLFSRVVYVFGGLVFFFGIWGADFGSFVGFFSFVFCFSFVTFAEEPFWAFGFIVDFVAYFFDDFGDFIGFVAFISRLGDFIWIFFWEYIWFVSGFALFFDCFIRVFSFVDGDKSFDFFFVFLFFGAFRNIDGGGVEF